jgi:chromosomal replication initiator protein
MLMVTTWDEVRHTLRASLGAMFDIWVAPVRLHQVTLDTPSRPRVQLVAPHNRIRGWIERCYQADLESAWCTALGVDAIELKIWVNGEEFEPTAATNLAEPTADQCVIALRPPTTLAKPTRSRSARELDEAPHSTAARSMPAWQQPAPQARLFPDPVAPPPPASGSMASASVNDSVLPSDKIFQNFVVGKCNEFAHAAARSVADDATVSRNNPLFIYGDTGLGKTHLMVAVGHHRLVSSPQTRVLYVTAEQFTNELIDSLRFKRMTEFRHKYRHNTDLLLMDDVQFVSGKERTQEELFHTFEWLRERGRQIVFTADVVPRDIHGFEPRLRTRCESGLVADIQLPDQETLIAILHDKAEACGRQIPPDVASYVAARVRGSIREVEGVVHRLDALCSLYRQVPTLAFVRAHLGNVLPDGPPKPEINHVLRVVASAYSIQVSQLLGRSKVRDLVLPRHVAMYLVRKHTGASFPVIGRHFGRDHTTVQHGYRKIEAKLKTDIELRQTVHSIERTIGC